MASESKSGSSQKATRKRSSKSIENNSRKRAKPILPQCTFCSKPSIKACLLSRCRGCCLKNRKPCSHHSEEAKAMKEFIEKVKNGDSLSFHFDEKAVEVYGKHQGELNRDSYLEDNFERFGDTVVLFCLEDFLSNPKFSSEALRAAERKRRRMRNEWQAIRNSFAKPMLQRNGCLERLFKMKTSDAGNLDQATKEFGDAIIRLMAEMKGN